MSDKGVYQKESVVVRARFSADPGAKAEPLPDGWTVHQSPVCLFDAQTKPGDRWEQKDGEVVKVFTAHAAEQVTVPAGEFGAAAVEVDTVAGGKRLLRHRYWYSPGAGAVKWTFDAGGDSGEIVMTSFTPAKK